MVSFTQVKVVWLFLVSGRLFLGTLWGIIVLACWREQLLALMIVPDSEVYLVSKVEMCGNFGEMGEDFRFQLIEEDSTSFFELPFMIDGLAHQRAKDRGGEG